MFVAVDYNFDISCHCYRSTEILCFRFSIIELATDTCFKWSVEFEVVVGQIFFDGVSVDLL